VIGVALRPGESRIGDWIINWAWRETGPAGRDPWRAVTFRFEDRPLSGQTYYPEDPSLGGGGSRGGDPSVVEARGLDANGFPEWVEVEWDTTDGRLRQAYRATGLSASGR